MSKAGHLFFIILLFSAAFFPSFAADESAPAGTVVFHQVAVTTVVRPDGTARIEGVKFGRIVASPEDDSIVGNIESTGAFTVKLFYGGALFSSSGFSVPSTLKQNTTFFSSFLLDGEATKGIEVILYHNNHEIDKELVVYCGDFVCSKGETVFACPSDCGKKVRLLSQQDSKTVPFLIGGGFLVLLAISVWIVARKS